VFGLVYTPTCGVKYMFNNNYINWHFRLNNNVMSDKGKKALHEAAHGRPAHLTEPELHV